MFRMLVHPSTGACDLFVELFHVLYCSGSMCVGVTVWFGWGGVVEARDSQYMSNSKYNVRPADTTPTPSPSYLDADTNKHTE